jgi:predicted nuclease with TOPRIM domain
MSNPYEHKYGLLMRQLRDPKFEGNDLIEDAANAIENLADEVQEMREGRNTLSAENKAIVRKLRGGELPVHLAAADAIERLSTDRARLTNEIDTRKGDIYKYHTRTRHAELRLKDALDLLLAIADDPTKAETAKAFVDNIKASIAAGVFSQRAGY